MLASARPAILVAAAAFVILMVLADRQASDPPVLDDGRGGAELPAGSIDDAADLPPVPPFATGTVALTSDGQRHDMPVYVADTAALRRQGLMGWSSLPEGAGMLFLFDGQRRGGFWMKDTVVPLSIAFADADGEVLAVLDMEPCGEEPCPSYDPGTAYRYALEVDQGWFDELGVEPGWRLQVVPLEVGGRGSTPGYPPLGSHSEAGLREEDRWRPG